MQCFSVANRVVDRNLCSNNIRPCNDQINSNNYILHKRCIPVWEQQTGLDI